MKTKDREQNEREVLNALATMPENSTATILGVRVNRHLFGFSIEGGAVMHGRIAARLIVATAENAGGNCD